MSEDDNQLVITLEEYFLCRYLLTCEGLKAKGLISGGPEVDLEFCKALVTLGERHGWPREVPEDEVHKLADYFRKGGPWEQEDESA